MYIQVTEKCNMHCSHCGFACTSKGQHMPRKIWKKALETSIDYDEQICIGGGEPTLHPDFWEIIGVAMGHCNDVWMATNGSITDTALALARLAEKGAISCALSQDEYHDPIDPKVVEAFTKIKTNFNSDSKDGREIRTVNNIIKTGRSKEGKKGCICEGMIVKPDGNVRACGCPNAPSFGTIFDFTVPDFYTGECYKEYKKSA